MVRFQQRTWLRASAGLIAGLAVAVAIWAWNSTARENVDVLRASLDDLTGRLEDARGEIADLADDNAALQDELEEARNLIEQRTSALETLKAKILAHRMFLLRYDGSQGAFRITDLDFNNPGFYLVEIDGRIEYRGGLGCRTAFAVVNVRYFDRGDLIGRDSKRFSRLTVGRPERMTIVTDTLQDLSDRILLAVGDTGCAPA